MLQYVVVKLDKIYTKGGDKGFTSLVGGKRVKKSSKIIFAANLSKDFFCFFLFLKSS